MKRDKCVTPNCNGWQLYPSMGLCKSCGYKHYMEKKKMKPIRKEFKGNVLVTVSENEVRLWVCNEQGENIFRFKALGKVHRGKQDIMVINERR
jgi:hypothetical protein